MKNVDWMSHWGSNRQRSSDCHRRSRVGFDPKYPYCLHMREQMNEHRSAFSSRTSGAKGSCELISSVGRIPDLTVSAGSLRNLLSISGVYLPSFLVLWSA